MSDYLQARFEKIDFSLIVLQNRLRNRLENKT